MVALRGHKAERRFQHIAQGAGTALPNLHFCLCNKRLRPLHPGILQQFRRKLLFNVAEISFHQCILQISRVLFAVPQCALQQTIVGVDFIQIFQVCLSMHNTC